MREPTTEYRSSARFAHLRMRLESSTTGHMKSGNPITSSTSVGSMLFWMAVQMMNPTETMISNGASATSCRTCWMMCWTRRGSLEARLISCPTSIRPWNCIDCSWMCRRIAHRMSFTVCRAAHERQYLFRKRKAQRPMAASGTITRIAKRSGAPRASSSP